MALYYDLPLYRDTYKFVLQIFEITKGFSREYKYSLGQDMKKEAISLVRNIYRANKNYDKKILNSANSYLGICKHYNSYKLRKKIIFNIRGRGL